MPNLYFGIPLRARAVSKDWNKVQSNLQRTLDALLAQDGVSPHILIAGHDCPEFLAQSHYESVRFIDVSERLAVPADVSGFSADKRAKKNWLGYSIAQVEREPFYYMHVDADDLLHRSFASSVLRSGNKQGYLISRGYMVDVGNRRLAPADENTKEFFLHCGTCAVIYFEPSELPTDPEVFSSPFSRFTRHGEYGEIAKKQGKKLSRITDYAAAYLVNHGENNRLYREQMNVKIEFVLRHQIDDPARVRQISSGFPGLSELLGLPA